jgi:hypothetical protein
MRVTPESLSQPIPMLIQKVFHIRQPIDEAQARLSKSPQLTGRFWNPGWFSGAGGGGSLWDAISMTGFQGALALELLPTEDKHQVLFRSTGEEVELCGLMELLPVRDRLTEVQLTLEYEMQSPWRRMMDRLLGVMNRRVDRQILVMQRQMDDDGISEQPARFTPLPFIPAPLANMDGEPHPAR